MTKYLLLGRVHEWEANQYLEDLHDSHAILDFVLESSIFVALYIYL